MSGPMPVVSAEVSVVPAGRAGDTALVAEITDLVNQVYAAAEAGLWRDGAERTTHAEVASMIASEQIAVARVRNQLVGTIRIQQLASGDGDLGMLVTAPHVRGTGVGRELVAFAERLSRERGCLHMQLELLVPRSWTHPFKEFLKGWYLRLGYQVVRVGTLDETYPALVPQLATACDLLILHKDLRGDHGASGSTDGRPTRAV